MRTEVTMKRSTLGEIISQKSKSGFFSATDLLVAGNKYRVMIGLPPTTLNAYFNSSSTKQFIKQLEEKYGKVKIGGSGRKPIGDYKDKDKTTTWVHPLLFLDIALWLDPKMKVEVYEWLLDNLLQFRNDSGDSYKKMCGALYLYAKNKNSFNQNIQKVANLIKLECGGVKNWNEATEQQLKLRDLMHEFIAFACDMVKDANMAIQIGIEKAKKSLGATK